MSLRSELGISPVLLQAIASLTSSTLTQSKDTNISSDQQSSSDKQLPNKAKMNNNQQSKDSTPDSGIVTQLLQNLHEPIASLMASAEEPKLSSSPNIDQAMITQAGLSMLGISRSDAETSVQPSTASSSLTSLPSSQSSIGMVISNEEMNNFLLKQEPSEDPHSDDTGLQVPQNLNTDVSNMLTALASQHMQQSSMLKSEQQILQTSLLSTNGHQPQIQNGSASMPPSVVIAPEKNKLKASGSDSGRSQPHIIIYSYDGREGAAPSHAANLDKNQSGTYRVLVSASEDGMEGTELKPAPFLPQQSEVSMTTTPYSVPVTSADQTQEGMSQPCPVCGDKVSGYHYGIFTCESCKGFFKRTVQNRKTFVCPKNSDCIITASNRKKCPSCRFTRCLVMGMKLEAIRHDRTRGGRSTYDGCLGPIRKPRASPAEKKPKRDVQQADAGAAGTSHEVEDGSKSHSNLVAILNHNVHKQPTPMPGVPQVPELLRDIMNLEALLSDDDISPDALMEGPFPEQALYSYMMKLAELRLYKLVRWARNLPQFGAISTDDQILLLQNCWSELMALSLCWRSIDTPDQLSISSTHHITADWAQHLGVEDVVQRLLHITAHFRKLYLDQFEYVALKVLLLITPDVKGLKEPRKIRDFQEKLQEALFLYTNTHYQNMQHKFGELLLRLPELSRISFITKDILLKSLPDSMDSCGLLIELLKGENKGDSEGGLRL